MAHIEITGSLRIPVSELDFETSRSGGPGGQNVNKLETRVELVFDVDGSRSLTDSQKEQIKISLEARMDSRGSLRIVSQESRSQWQNKQKAIEKFADLIRRALKPKKKRLKTRPSSRAKEIRMQRKKQVGEKKKLRKVDLIHE